MALLCASTPALAESVLILPFFNGSADQNLDWIGESLSEAVREALAAEGLITLDRDAREEAYRRLSVRRRVPLTRATVLRLGEVLDAGSVVYGRFEYTPPAANEPRIKGTLKIVAQILSLRKASRSPEYTELGALEELANLQTQMAWQLTRAILPDSALTQEEFHARRPKIRVEAVENYIRGLLASAPEARMKFLSQAVRLEPQFSQASFELGRSHFSRREWKQASEHLRRVGRHDLHYREATFLLGLCHYRTGDYKSAEAAFRSVVEHVPLNEVWNNLAAAQLRLRQPEALDNFRKALEGDPGDPDYHFNVGLALFRRGAYDEAATSFRAVLDRTPEDAEAIALLGKSLQADRRTGERRASSAAGAGDPPERIKESFEESAWLQLKAVLQPSRKGAN